MTLPSAIKPIRKRQTVQDQVYLQLREALVCGAYEAGQTFTITALAEQFMTSHMPVREALRRLAAENALQILPSGTAMVPELDISELKQIHQVRLMLEPSAAELAFTHLTGPAQEALAAVLAKHKRAGEAGDVAALLSANREVHFCIYTASENHVLVSQIENLWLRSGAYVRFLSTRMEELFQTSFKDGFAEHHDAMAAALAADNKAGFRRAMEADICATFDLLMNFLSDAPN